MKTQKKTHKVFAAWDFEEEERLYNEMSGKGWQAVKAGCFSQTYVWDDSVTYRYRMDYNNKIEDKTRYIEMFEEQGWEYLNSTFNGWHCFRKLYREELPEEEYQIYTDETSAKEMRNRWMRLAGIMLLLFGIVCLLRLRHLIMTPSLVEAVYFAVYAYIVSFLAFGYVKMKRKRRRTRSRSFFWGYLIICVLLGICTGVLVGMRSECHANCNVYVSDIASGEAINSFEVKYRDYYYLTLKLDAKIPVSFLISDEKGREIYQITTAQANEKKQLKLEKGNYDIRVWADESSEDNENIKLEYEIE